MSKALSLDLWQRVVTAVRDEGLSHREAGARFKVSAASISRWRALERQSGDLRPGPLGGDRRSAAIEASAGAILRTFEARRDMTNRGTAWRVGPPGPAIRLRHAVAVLRAPPADAQKKTAHAAEQDRPDVLRHRWAWFEDQIELEPDRLVFVDESWASTNMAQSPHRLKNGQLGERARNSLRG